ncbi:mandelate racemase/muconate lactonizing enzyme family protein [Paenibacillus rhizophilus]|uniref:Mandelate racemase/muconate lactonizing enzyme family protein n=1 Tax=Paenibacillus rhizophilus TaxID=1850366 RepID=A0A3N9NYA4_9BACL|nr:mandelate racemase/muconate lactonizing enzyme family protein [Paenibacillus rhizophilus]RQW08287.1 mandelate racemase/muconate lactonizing enzyme family protein [Paenibacillus rhizophilus]
MKITRVEAIPVRQGNTIELINDSAQDGIIIKVHTDEGIIGIGEVDSAPWVVKSIIDTPSSHRICQGLGEMLIGENPFEIERIWEKLYVGSTFYGRRGVVIHAISGIDIALWDIMGKALNLPVYKLLGGAQRGKVRAYASTLMPYTPQEAYDETKKWVQQGYTAIKLGWGGFEQGNREIVELVKASREAAGPNIDLLFDLGFIPSDDHPIDAASRMALVKELEPFAPYWIEEPLFADDYEGYRKLAESTSIRIAGGENETTRYGFKELIEQGGVDIVQPDVTRCGGLSEAKRIAQLAHAHHITCVPHAWSSGIVIAASLHLVTAIPNGALLEYCVAETPIRQEMLLSDVTVKDGYAEITDKPGLGVELNEEALEKYRCDR